VQLGMRKNPSDMCKHGLHPQQISRPGLTKSRRTYGDGVGEDIREGYQPTDDVGVAVVDGEDGEGNEFAVGDEEPSPQYETSQPWAEEVQPSVLLKPKYGVEGEAFDNVWGRGESTSETAKENP
jgi:hypothetical protein